MAISDEITRLQQAKADIKTAIEGKGVTVSSSATLDDYADLIDNISTGGGGSIVPTLVNPFNGADAGTPTSYGTLTHQYQVSSGTIVSCSLSCTTNWYTTSSVGSINSESYPWHTLKSMLGDYIVNISDSGLLTISFNRNQGQVEEYNWTYGNASRYIEVTIILDSGITLHDYFGALSHYTCFIKDTEISLASGDVKKIQDVTYDDELLVWNFDEGKYDNAKPLWIKKVQTTTWYYKLKFSNGLELKVTGTYPEAHSLFSVEDGKFIHANKLVGKKVYTLDGIATLESCEEVRENVEFYNIIANYHMNLFANNVLTSTSLNNLYPINDMKFVKEDRRPVFDYTQFSDDWIVGARLKEQPTDVTKYCLNCIKLSKCQ